jgi:hypothetical protein
VIDALIRFDPLCEIALLVVVRGDVVIGWKGFRRSGAELPELAVPLDQPGLIPEVVSSGELARSSAAELSVIDKRLLESLEQTSGDLVVVPITIAGHVMCALAMVVATDAPTATAEAIAGSAGAAFARLMRDASR